MQNNFIPTKQLFYYDYYYHFTYYYTKLKYFYVSRTAHLVPVALIITFKLQCKYRNCNTEKNFYV